MHGNEIKFNEEQFGPMGDNKAPYQCEGCDSYDCKGCPVLEYGSTLTEVLAQILDGSDINVELRPINIGIFGVLKGAFLPKKLKQFLADPSEKNISLISDSPKSLYKFYKIDPQKASNIFTFDERKKVAEIRTTYDILCAMIHSMGLTNEDANIVSMLLGNSNLSEEDKKDIRELLNEKLS